MGSLEERYSGDKAYLSGYHGGAFTALSNLDGPVRAIGEQDGSYLSRQRQRLTHPIDIALGLLLRL